MQNKPFTVMDASAGSGKTRNLVKAVLLRTLQNNDPKNGIKSTLALTFTNDAAAEMKHRLLDYLIDFNLPEPKDTAFLNEIATDLGLTASVVRTRAKQTLKYILHNFNDLSFSTLDGFTSRLVRTFAKDLALSENFEILLDLDELLHEATDRVLSLVGQDPVLTNVLVRFLEEKLAEERSPNLDQALINAAKKLLEERHKEPLSRLRNFSAEQLLDIRHKLNDRKNQLVAHLSQEGQNIKAFVESHNISLDSFSQKSSGLASYLKSCIGGDFIKAYTINYRTQYIEKNAWFSKSSPAHIKEAITNIVDELREQVLAVEAFARENASFVLLVEGISKNIFSLATLNALNQALTSLTEARNTIPLANFNHLINEKLKNEPSLYIYERLGERYNHYFLDEFQDTSLLQWENIKPLLIDSLSGTGSALLVGDAKQSIYRWRNGEAEQFIALSENAAAGIFQYAGDAKRIQLNDNWRSLENVVNFNNALFLHAAEKMKTDSYKQLYLEAAQNPKKAAGGKVELHLISKDNYSEDAIEKAIQSIHDFVTQGYNYGDIALLVRRKKDGAALVEALTTAKVPVLSADSLLLGNAYECRFLAGLTALRTKPDHLQMRWLLADAALSGGFIIPEEGNFKFANGLINGTARDAIKRLAETYDHLEDAFVANDDLIAFTRKIIGLLGWDGTNNTFVEGYIQAVHDFVEIELGTDAEFVGWWQTYGADKPIRSAKSLDAVEVVTIHKSKGLQYPVVIIPFATWQNSQRDNEAWVKLDEETFEGLSEMILPLNKEKASIIGGDYAEKQAEREAQLIFDSLNMLYVACTRAIENLVIFTKPASEKNTSGTIGSFLTDFAAQADAAKREEHLYVWGDHVAKTKKQSPPIQKTTARLITQPWFSKLKLAQSAIPGWENETHDARQWGNKVHWTLSKIETVHDVPLILAQLLQNGSLTQDEGDKITGLINAVVTHPQLADAYKNGIRVYNERDILLPEGTRKRPDRLVQQADDTFILIDYKTGSEEDKHQKQLRAYATLLQEAGFTLHKSLLVYLNEDINVLAV